MHDTAVESYNAYLVRCSLISGLAKVEGRRVEVERKRTRVCNKPGRDARLDLLNSPLPRLHRLGGLSDSLEAVPSI